MRIGIFTILAALILSGTDVRAEEIREIGVAFLVDVSGSMGSRTGKKWQSVQKALNEGLAQVKKHAHDNAGKVKVEAAVFLFDSRFYTSLDILAVDEKFPAHLEVNVDQFGGGTSLDTALFETQKSITKRSKLKDWHIIALTDGNSTGDPLKAIRSIKKGTDGVAAKVSMIAYEMEDGPFEKWRGDLEALSDANAEIVGQVLKKIVQQALAEKQAGEKLYDACEVKPLKAGTAMRKPVATDFGRAQNSVLSYFKDPSALEKIGEAAKVDYDTVLFEACNQKKGDALAQCLQRECTKIVYRPSEK